MSNEYVYGSLLGRPARSPITAASNGMIDAGLIDWYEWIGEDGVLYAGWRDPKDFTWDPINQFAFTDVPDDVQAKIVHRGK